MATRAAVRGARLLRPSATTTTTTILLPRAAAPARSLFLQSHAYAVRPRKTLSLRPAAATRWYSVGGDGDGDGSRTWGFDEIKDSLEGKSPKDHQDADVVVIDVREVPELLETGKIPGAINIPITSAVQSFHVPDADFESMYGFPRPAKDAHLLFYCKAGVRARAAAGLARHAGWKSVGVYPGSWLDWAERGGPVEGVKRGEGGGD